ncbi:hypothetical protein [Sandaracinus amylolyticus]|uniref:hypothetical protein n=1 Tax=Sandaracinus amylolyticus TaxID=927083 RepID=UPI001F427402|nr:hypothetical protein [Sandaracinus amylolyticus]
MIAQLADEALELVVHRQHRDLVALRAQRGFDLRHDDVGRVARGLDVGEDRDAHVAGRGCNADARVASRRNDGFVRRESCVMATAVAARGDREARAW